MSHRRSAPPILSIVIPTRNREVYAESLIRALLAIEAPDLEVVVRDNGDRDRLAAAIDTLRDDPRLVYDRDAGPISSFENFLEAVRLASGTYVAVVGDDDVVNPEILDAARWANRNSVDAFMSYAWAANYYWPDFRSARDGAAIAGTLLIRDFSARTEPVDPRRELDRCMTAGGLGMQRLPKLYLGVVRGQCVYDALARFGDRQFGTCPDMFFAVALASTCRKVVEIDYPLIVPGASAPSTAGDVAMGTHEGDLQNAPHLRARPDYVWPERLPAFYSYETFYAESALSAVEGTDPAAAHRFNFPLVYAICWRKHPERAGEIRAAWKSLRLGMRRARRSVTAATATHGIRIAAQAVSKLRKERHLRGRTSRVAARYAQTNDSEAAVRVLSEHLARIGMNIHAVLR